MAKINDQFKVKWRYIKRNIVVIPVISLSAFFTLNLLFAQLSMQYQGYDKFIDRDFLYQPPESRYLVEAEDHSSTSQSFVDVLTRVKQRGFIRVGYFRDDLPYSFHNKQGKLVGYDIEILNLLALDLGVDIEFVRIFHDQATNLLSSGYLDITSGIPVIPDNMSKFTLTVPYSQQSIAFLVKDERRAEFTQWSSIINRNDLIIGIPETFFYQDKIEQRFTHGKAWEISTPRLFFKEEFQHIDGMLFGAAAASAWTLLYPDYTVVVPKPVRAPLFMAFPINKDDLTFELFMRNWIEMKKQSGELEQLFNYWIKGDALGQ